MKIMAVSTKKAVSNKKTVENNNVSHAPMANKKAVSHDTFVKSCKK